MTVDTVLIIGRLYVANTWLLSGALQPGMRRAWWPRAARGHGSEANPEAARPRHGRGAAKKNCASC
jgi:hypothetical protein